MSGPPLSHILMNHYFRIIIIAKSLINENLYGTGAIMKSKISSLSYLTGREMKKAHKGFCQQSVKDDLKVNLVHRYDQKLKNNT